MQKKKKKGFSLIELAVVLTIVGVLIGAAVVGASLITTARLQTVITDYQKYKTAAYEFKEKYGYYPGDFPNAYNYWGSSSNGTAACTDNNVNSVAGGCNGNGDGVIYLGYSATDIDESSGFWTQLLKANFISGNVNTPSTFTGPKTAFPKTYFIALNTNIGSVTTNTLAVSNHDTSRGGLSGEDAYSIDLKIDDGRPETDSNVGAIDGNDVCVSDSGTASASYNLNNTNPDACLSLFKF